MPNSLIWKDLSVSVRDKKPKEKTKINKQILYNVTGIANSGEILAIMGPSGSGKTTLLNLLAQGAHVGQVFKSGDVYYNGNILHVGKDKKNGNSVTNEPVIGYCAQRDDLLGVFTVEELIRFSAKLRSGCSQNINNIVDEVIDQLRLTSLKSSRVGDDKVVGGLSGGERKRVAIGTELVVSPEILLIDEITSGLDSHIANRVVSVISDVCKQRNLICIFTIHQPSSKMYNLFDKLCLLEGGRVCYFGEANDAPINYFETVLNAKIPKLTNPCEFFLDVIMDRSCIDIEGSAAPVDKTDHAGNPNKIQSDVDIENNINIENNTNISNSIPSFTSHIDDIYIKLQNTQSCKVDNPSINNKLPWYSEFKIVLSREYLNFLRDPWYFWTQLSTNIFMGLFVGAIYHSHDGANMTDASTRLSAIFFSMLNICFAPYMSVMVRFPLARAVFNREREANYYSTTSFFLAYFLVDIPAQLVMTFVFSVCVYWTVGFRNTAEAFFIWILLLYLLYQVCQSLALACTAAFPTVTGSMMIGSIFLIVFMSFGGYFLSLNELPPGSRWLSDISMFTYIFEGLAYNDLRDSFEGWEAVIEPYGLKDQLGVDIVVICAMILIYRLFTFLVLYYFRGSTKI